MSTYRKTCARLAQEVDPVLAETCLPGPDEAQLGRYAQMKQQAHAFHAFDKAHVVMLAEQKLLSEADAALLLGGLREMESGDLATLRARTGEPMHAAEAHLGGRLGTELAGKINLARSSGDLLSVSFRMTLRARVLVLLEAINRVRSSMISLAKAHVATVMPGYTHMQPAQPTTFGHYLMSMCCGFDRDVDRHRAFYHRLNRSPAGAAILVGSSFAINRTRTAGLLGFESLERNTRDAVWGRDLEIESHSLATILAGNINRLAEDLMLWSSPEYGMLECSDSLCGTSSIMAQKKNPSALEHLKGLVSSICGHLVASVIVHKNPSAAPALEWMRLLADHWRNCDDLTDGLRLLDRVIESVQVNVDRMLDLACRHGTTVVDLAALLVRKEGLPWRTAHLVSGTAVRLAMESGRAVSSIDAELLQRAARSYCDHALTVSTDDVSGALDPRRSVERHAGSGGPAGNSMRAEFECCEASLREDEQWVQGARDRLSAASRKLEEAMDELIHR